MPLPKRIKNHSKQGIEQEADIIKGPIFPILNWWEKRLLKITRWVAFDVETTGFDWWNNDTMFAWVQTEWDGTSRVHRNKTRFWLTHLQRLFSDPSIGIIAHNAKFDLHFAIKAGITIPEDKVIVDTLVMWQILRNLSPSHELDYLAYDLCGWPRELDKHISILGKEYGGYQNIPEHEMNKYQIYDGQRTMLLFRTGWEEIKDDRIALEDFAVEMELVKTTLWMEERGVKLNEVGLTQVERHCKEEIDKSNETLQLIAGEPINPGSGPQVASLLYRKLRIPAINKTGSGNESTDKDTLNELRDGLISGAIQLPDPDLPGLKETAIERRKRIATDRALTVLENLQRYRSAIRGRGVIRDYRRRADKDMVIHPSIGTNSADTGRQTCKNPNAQNVGKGGGEKNPYAVGTRNCFSPRHGFVLMPIDESGIEIRLIAELSNCSRLKELIKRNDEGDTESHPHIVACRIFFGDKFISKKESKTLYDIGKNAHFGIWYGAEVETFARALNISTNEAIPIYNEYKRQFPESGSFIRDRLTRVMEEKFITTSFGRRLQIPHGHYYAWLNYAIQGVAAGIIKRAQVACGKLIQREPWTGKVFMLFPVHDEVIFEVHLSIVTNRELFFQLNEEITNCMTKFPEISTSLAVESKLTHTTWAEAKDATLWLKEHSPWRLKKEKRRLK